MEKIYLTESQLNLIFSQKKDKYNDCNLFLTLEKDINKAFNELIFLFKNNIIKIYTIDGDNFFLEVKTENKKERTNILNLLNFIQEIEKTGKMFSS